MRIVQKNLRGWELLKILLDSQFQLKHPEAVFFSFMWLRRCRRRGAAVNCHWEDNKEENV